MEDKLTACEHLVIVDQVLEVEEEEELKLEVIIDQVPVEEEEATELTAIVDQVLVEEEEATELTVVAVSYTHLTLPTIYSV